MKVTSLKETCNRCRLHQTKLYYTLTISPCGLCSCCERSSVSRYTKAHLCTTLSTHVLFRGPHHLISPRKISLSPVENSELIDAIHSPSFGPTPSLANRLQCALRTQAADSKWSCQVRGHGASPALASDHRKLTGITSLTYMRLLTSLCCPLCFRILRRKHTGNSWELRYNIIMTS
jgi:hypothetical protein